MLPRIADILPVVAAILAAIPTGLAMARPPEDPASSRTAPEKGKHRPIPDPRRKVGSVIKFDAEKGEVAIGYGKERGAEVGMTLKIYRHNPPFEDQVLTEIVIIATGEKESIGRVPDDFAKFIRPGLGEEILPGDELFAGLEVGDAVGLVADFNQERGEVRINFGQAMGAAVGMTLTVRRDDPRPDLFGRVMGNFEDLGRIEVIDVQDRGSIAKIIKSEHGMPEENPDFRPGDQVVYATDNEAFRVLKLATGDHPGAVEELKRYRAEVARRRFAACRSGYEVGRVNIDRYIDASREWMEARRDLAGHRDEELTALRAHLDRMTRLVERETGRFEVEDGSYPNLSEARSAQAEAALMLARARRDAAGGPGREGPPPPGDPLKPEVRKRPLVGETIGRVTGFDRESGEARIDFGAADGAVVGMRLKVIRLLGLEEFRGFDPDEPDRITHLEWHLEVKAIEEHASLATLINREGRDRGNRPPLREIRPGDDVYCTSDREAARVSRLATGDRPDAVAELTRTRLEAARRWQRASKAYWQQGTINADRYLDACRRLMEALREAGGEDEQVLAIRAQLERMTRLIEDEANNFYFEHEREPTLSEARSSQVEAATMLKRAAAGR
jgi:hypothetical protein